MTEADQGSAGLLHFAPGYTHSVAEVLAGLRAPRKSLPTRLLYDARGMELFEAICETDEYYLTRVELGILRDNIREMAASIGPDNLLVEFGSGNGLKTQLLLEHLSEPVAYVPIEIEREALEQSAQMLRRSYPGL